GQWTQAASAPSAVAEGEAIDESVSGMALDAGSMEVLSGSLDMTSKQAEPIETEGGGEADRENKDGKENVEVVKAAHDEPNAGPAARVVAAPRLAAAATAADRAPAVTEMTVNAEAGSVEVASEIAMSADVQTAMAAFAVEVSPPPKTLPKAAKKLIYKLRKPEERKKIIKELGASEDTEKAVQAALEWLAKNQSDDGRWDFREFKSAGQVGGQGGANQPIASTGLSILAFLGAGYTHTEGKHKDVVKKGLDWLMANQRADGYFFAGGGRANSMYAHGMATTAICEAYSMTQDANLVVAAQKGATLIMNSQKAPGGWRYAPSSTDSDTSVVGWQVLALKSAEIAGIPVPQKHYDGVAKWLDSVRHGTNGGLYNYAPGNAGGISMTPEGWFCQLFISEGQKTRGMAESIKYVMGRLPSAGNKNAYYLYYATMALHLADAKESEKWNAALAKMLLPTQRKDGAAAGSWNPDGFAYGGAGGRVYVTVMATLCLEVYYRYLPFYKQN
ncbi:MAG: terpene cyclase/mutase family protein, partial [Phycisphaerae bacterium]|nr:terpene cyclase/mutase family protein [Phycisphaerae bacterium]